MADLIDRQAAIDAVEHITSSMSVCVNTDECHGMKRMQRQAVIELANLPSAQPEQKSCKTCHLWEGGEINIACPWGSNYEHYEDDYCSLWEKQN